MKTETIQEELCIEVCQPRWECGGEGGWGEVGGLWLSILKRYVTIYHNYYNLL